MQTLQAVFESLTKDLPTFPDGRINYTDAKTAPVINIVGFWDEKILILKRSERVSAYKGLWNGVSGYIDEPKPLEDFVVQEIDEELSIQIKSGQVRISEPYEVKDEAIDRIWFVYPALVMFEVKPVIKIDWEHDDFQWIEPKNLNQYSFVKDFDKSVKKALALL